ncbi:uncharacterized protein ASPGLDRAFT_53497 [Aspergillus glaucus CBS 516.65]|uniref:HTH psq-type domain-containing protein n=1 Tax=Aspergillus glaucus CBS 516.65 TaxID=1160497 RepID=A0A1L9V401_ASPGL|nr:hypothetical protein ASPGLDRAFT_53497 [Aspergillus glaucus CBS 516.65]OJJ78569.1 hypothetical protein ASPGLDRAFT_53497 [Aspergillus glaucus CBS 516.65]
MPQKHDECQVILALQAMQNDKKLSARAAGKIYHVDHEKLSRCRRGMQTRCNISANSQRLTDLEESTIVEVQLKEETCNGAGRRLRTETRAALWQLWKGQTQCTFLSDSSRDV